MKISSKGRYALRLMIDIARHRGDGWISLGDIAERQNISVKYLEQIVTSLTKNGLLTSCRGPSGGYKLSREPSEYRVGDILRAIEGKLVPVACLEADENNCPRAKDCPTLGFWTGLYETVNNYVDQTTLDKFL